MSSSRIARGFYDCKTEAALLESYLQKSGDMNYEFRVAIVIWESEKLIARQLNLWFYSKTYDFWKSGLISFSDKNSNFTSHIAPRLSFVIMKKSPGNWKKNCGKR